MSADRKPQVGEVWTGYVGAYECILCPDQRGMYVWLVNGEYVVATQGHLTPPKPTPPAWLADVWVNVYASPAESSARETAARADVSAAPDRIGRVSLAGEWVPCRGREVLG